jgi:ABC-type amino acid transport system permease subunit
VSKLAPGVHDVAAFGNSIHILVESAAPALEALPEYLAQRGVAVTRIEQVEPTIEDIFVQMIGAEAKAVGLRRLKAIAVKEVLQIWRDSISLMIALLMPFMQMILLGYGISLDVKHLPRITCARGTRVIPELSPHF